MAVQQAGEFWLTSLGLTSEGQGQLRVDRADPVVRISPEVLAEMPASGAPATYDPRSRLLRVRGVNRTVVYLIREALEPVPGCPGQWHYIGEWPDLGLTI